MFRSLKKKRPISEIGKRVLSSSKGIITTTTTTNDNNDNSASDDPIQKDTTEGNAVAMNKLKRERRIKERPKLQQLSFYNNNDDDDNDTNVDVHTHKSGFASQRPKRDSSTIDITSTVTATDSANTYSTTNEMRHKKQRRTGFGFGGGTTTTTTTTSTTTSRSDQPRIMNDDDDDDNNNNGMNLYSKESLSKLLNEQKLQPQPKPSTGSDVSFEAASIQLSTPASNTINPPTTTNNETDMNEDYIPFQLPVLRNENNNRSEILTGDEALAFVERQDSTIDEHSDNDTATMKNHEKDENDILHHPVMAPPSSVLHHNELKDDINHEEEWEAEVIRRAGITTSSATPTPNAPPPPPPYHRTNEITTTSNSIDGTLKRDRKNPIELLKQLRTQITMTIEKMQHNQTDLERQNQRRSNDIEMNEQVLLQQETTLKASGAAFEFYQQWRNEYMIWMGAMRELKTKIDSIVISMHILEHDIAATERYQEWYDSDVITILMEYNVIDQIIGNTEHVQRLQNQERVDDPPDQVLDEFGRSIVSQAKIQREKRRLHRRRICEQRYRNRNMENMMEETTIVLSEELHRENDSNVAKYVLRGDESDGLISEDEMETYRERHEALQGALVVSMSEIHEDYIKLHKLVALFSKWYETYPDEYKSSQASYGFIQLASVLIQAELCSLNDPWNESGGYNESKWVTAIHAAMDRNLLDVIHIERLFLKCIIPNISDLLLNQGVNLLSTRQAKSLHVFMIHLQKLLPPNNVTWLKLMNVLKTFLAKSLDNITIITMNEDQVVSLVPKSAKKDEYDEAMFSAAWGQMYRIQKIIQNIFYYWVPLLQNESDFRTTILYLVCNKYIRLILSVQTMESLLQHGGKKKNGLSESPADFFHRLQALLRPTKWLDLPEHIEYSTTVQAASLLFQMRSELE